MWRKRENSVSEITFYPSTLRLDDLWGGGEMSPRNQRKQTELSNEISKGSNLDGITW